MIRSTSEALLEDVSLLVQESAILKLVQHPTRDVLIAVLFNLFRHRLIENFVFVHVAVLIFIILVMFLVTLSSFLRFLLLLFSLLLSEEPHSVDLLHFTHCVAPARVPV